MEHQCAALSPFKAPESLWKKGRKECKIRRWLVTARKTETVGTAGQLHMGPHSDCDRGTKAGQAQAQRGELGTAPILV